MAPLESLISTGVMNPQEVLIADDSYPILTTRSVAEQGGSLFGAETSPACLAFKSVNQLAEHAGSEPRVPF